MYSVNANQLLEEFELIERLIAKADTIDWLPSDLFKTLPEKRDDMVRRLDEITRPYRKSLKEILAERRALPPLMTCMPQIGFEYDGKFISCTCCLDIWRKLLRTLWRDFPERRAAMAAYVARLGTSRKYISTEREGLFTRSKTSRWVKKHSRELPDGWYMDVNVTPERIHKILPVAVSAAGLKWGMDIRVIWLSTVDSIFASSWTSEETNVHIRA